MAGRQGHIGYFGYVPGRYDQSARIGVFAYLIEHLRYLVDVLAVGCGPGAPLHAIDRAQIALVIGPFVPDGDWKSVVEGQGVAGGVDVGGGRIIKKKKK